MQHFCTTIPSRRISGNGRLELRAFSPEKAFLRVNVVLKDRVHRAGRFCVPAGREVRLYPELSGIAGRFSLELIFETPAGKPLETLQQPYEIVPSEVHSTRLLDGCWISLVHWSDQEARYFNTALRQLNDSDWKQHVQGMHRLGITSALIQNVFDSPAYVCQHDMTADHYAGKAMYPSALYPERVPMAAEDPVEAVLSAADECGMAVFMGVGLYAWFDFSPESLEWHKRVALELHRRYGRHPSFYGWYVSEEIMGALYYGYDPVPDEKHKEIAVFFREFRSFVQALTPTKPVALAPNNIHMDWYREEWRAILANVDILIPFAFARSENNIPQIADMCAETGTHFWVDMEIFRFPFDEGLRPKTFEDLLKEIRSYDMLEQIYGYQYTGLLNEPGKRMGLGMPETEEVYAQYQRYVQTVTAIGKKPLI